MRLLLDTHVFLSWDDEPERLSQAALAALVNPANQIHLSVVSIWEIAIKAQRGKLSLRQPLSAKVAGQQHNGLHVLDVTLPHVLAVESLPSIHKDPFDRLLIAQAGCEAMILVTADSAVARYGVPVLW